MDGQLITRPYTAMLRSLPILGTPLPVVRATGIDEASLQADQGNREH